MGGAAFETPGRGGGLFFVDVAADFALVSDLPVGRFALGKDFAGLSALDGEFSPSGISSLGRSLRRFVACGPAEAGAFASLVTDLPAGFAAGLSDLAAFASREALPAGFFLSIRAVPPGPPLLRAGS